MASDLLIEFLARQPALRWESARVVSVQAGDITVSMNGGDVANVDVLSTYVPRVGELAACLIFGPTGIVAIGAVSPRTVAEPPVSAYVTVNPVGFATWTIPNQALNIQGSWTPDELVQARGRVGVFFYADADFAVLAGRVISSVEIELEATTATTPVFQVHGSAGPIGSYLPLTNEQAYRTIEANVSTWITLPIGIGEGLVDPAIVATGIGLSANIYDVPPAVFTGHGTLRFTTLT